MVDYMLWPWFERFSLLNEINFDFNANENFPKLATWIKTMNINENVQKVKIPIEITKKFMNSYRQGKPEYDIE